MTWGAITASFVREVLSYSPETGAFTWRDGGAEAGFVDAKGYRRIKVMQTQIKAHRLAWLYEHGSWPDRILRHKNGDRADNRIANLCQAMPPPPRPQGPKREFLKNEAYLKFGYSSLREAVFGLSEVLTASKVAKALSIPRSTVSNYRWESKFPDRRRAHKMVEVELRAGRMSRLPCEVCGSTHSHAHHPDYEKPLDVTWLCPPCHKMEHRQ